MILTKQGTDTIHPFIATKYQKYTPIITLKHDNALDKLNTLPCVHLLNMTPHETCSIKTHVSTMTIWY